MKQLLDKLSFKTEQNQLVDLFGTKAQKIADMLEQEATTSTQFRKFYEKVIELNDKAIGLDQNSFDTKIKPFVVMLNSKVKYSRNRKVCGDRFVDLMSISIGAVNSVEELQNFKYFLESIIGFMPKK